MYKLVISNRSIFVFFAFLAVLPATNIGFAFPLQYFFIPFWILYLFFNLKTKLPSEIVAIFTALLILSIYVLLNSLIIGSLKMNRVGMNLDFIPYLFKAITFLGVFIFVYRTKAINSDLLLKLYLFIGLSAMLVSLLQWLPSPISKFMVEIYAYKDSTIAVATRDVLWTKRVQGFAFHAPSTGGAGAFFFIPAFYSYFILKKHRKLSLILMILVLASTLVFTQARMGSIALLFVAVLIGLFSLKKQRDLIILITSVLVIIGVVILILKFSNIQDSMFFKQFNYVWRKMYQQIMEGGNRLRQIKEGFAHMNLPYDFFTGISRPYQNANKFLIEVEPAYFLIIYGFIGLVLAYFPLLIIYYITSKIIRRKNSSKESSLHTLNLSMRVMLPTYVFYSFGFTYYRDIYIPLISWIFYAAVFALNYRKDAANAAV